MNLKIATLELLTIALLGQSFCLTSDRKERADTLVNDCETKVREIIKKPETVSSAEKTRLEKLRDGSIKSKVDALETFVSSTEDKITTFRDAFLNKVIEKMVTAQDKILEKTVEFEKKFKEEAEKLKNNAATKGSSSYSGSAFKNIKTSFISDVNSFLRSSGKTLKSFVANEYKTNFKTAYRRDLNKCETSYTDMEKKWEEAVRKCFNKFDSSYRDCMSKTNVECDNTFNKIGRFDEAICKLGEIHSTVVKEIHTASAKYVEEQNEVAKSGREMVAKYGSTLAEQALKYKRVNRTISAFIGLAARDVSRFNASLKIVGADTDYIHLFAHPEEFSDLVDKIKEAIESIKDVDSMFSFSSSSGSTSGGSATGGTSTDATADKSATGETKWSWYWIAGVIVAIVLVLSIGYFLMSSKQ